MISEQLSLTPNQLRTTSSILKLVTENGIMTSAMLRLTLEMLNLIQDI